jgi:outer membrane protein assembly factor BamB
MRCAAVSLLLGLTGLVLGNPSGTGNPGTWPQWRGPKRDGTVETLPWPDKLDETHLKPMWRHDIGPGYSGPIVSKDLVFTVETEDKKREIARAFDRATGEQMWEKAWKGAMKVPFFAARNGSWVRSTPAYDGKNLYIAGMRDVLTCLDVRNGMLRWRVDFVERFKTPVPDFGLVCSPLILDGAVYVQAGGGLVKLDKTTGEVQWRSLEDGGGMYGSAFSSPILHELGGVSQLLVQTRNAMAGVAPHDGEVLWQQPIKAFRGMNILTPVAFEDNIFTSSYGGYSLLYDCEYQDDRFTLSEMWRDKKSQGYMSTPVVIDGHIYLLRRDRRFCCIDLDAREIRWVSKGKFGQYWSLAANGTRILALDQKGELLLIEANPEAFRLLDRSKIAKQDTWAHVAVAGDQVFVRELKAIAAYRWRAPVVAAQQ